MVIGIKGKTEIVHSNQVAFGSDGSVNGTGTKPRAIIAAPTRAEFLWAL
jgi:hypothetical protein